MVILVGGNVFALCCGVLVFWQLQKLPPINYTPLTDEEIAQRQATDAAAACIVVQTISSGD